VSTVLDAPGLAASLQWINCEPQALPDLRGRVVALAFWHAGSGYCHNLLDDLQELQRRHADALTVIGIHTPKFAAERGAALVLKAVNRLQLQFPVALDAGFAAWQQYGIEAWPTVLLLDTEGQRARMFVGDLRREAIDAAVVRLLESAGRDRRVFEPQPPCVRAEPSLPLAFPAGLAVDGSHLYVADSGHHRVLECSLEGRVLRQFGTGTPGLIDGISAEACFRRPQGLFLSREMLYVADTGNHALRRIRLLDGEVDTLAGTGRPGVFDSGTPRAAEGVPLNAPAHLIGTSDRLYVAMAGGCQVWEIDQGHRTLRVLAGDGRLALVDGGSMHCSFAQPVALARVDQTLYVLDAAASALRGLHLPSGAVHTLVGHGLFDFGDQDGVRSQASMQWPGALVADARAPTLWIADTYNNLLRSFRIVGGELRRHALNYPLHEPAALAASPGTLWLANTNAHEVLRVDTANFTARRLPIGE
jgi:thiol-disulfide isomerase/thioredoxin